MAESAVHSAIRACAAERHFRADTVERWLLLADDDGAALLELAVELRLGDNQLRDLWDWAEEIASRLEFGIAAVLTEGAVRAARDRVGSRNDKLKAVKAALRRMRFPHLARQEDRMGALVKQLDLPSAVRLEWPAFLEGDTLSIAFDVRSPAALAAVAAALAEAAQRPECTTLFALLDGEPTEGAA